MKALVRMWSNTRMVVLTAVAAAVYAAVLIPFKAIPIALDAIAKVLALLSPSRCSFHPGSQQDELDARLPVVWLVDLRRRQRYSAVSAVLGLL